MIEPESSTQGDKNQKGREKNDKTAHKSKGKSTDKSTDTETRKALEKMNQNA